MFKWLKKLFVRSPSIVLKNIPNDITINIILGGGAGGSGGVSPNKTGGSSGGQAAGFKAGGGNACGSELRYD